MAADKPRPLLQNSLLLTCYHHLRAKLGIYIALCIFLNFWQVWEGNILNTWLPIPHLISMQGPQSAHSQSIGSAWLPVGLVKIPVTQIAKTAKNATNLFILKLSILKTCLEWSLRLTTSLFLVYYALYLNSVYRNKRMNQFYIFGILRKHSHMMSDVFGHFWPTYLVDLIWCQIFNFFLLQ